VTMHPWILQQLISEREAELRRRRRHVAPAGPRAHAAGRVRARVGWKVVDLGLRLAAAPRIVLDLEPECPGRA